MRYIHVKKTEIETPKIIEGAPEETCTDDVVVRSAIFRIRIPLVVKKTSLKGGKHEIY